MITDCQSVSRQKEVEVQRMGNVRLEDLKARIAELFTETLKEDERLRPTHKGNECYVTFAVCDRGLLGQTCMSGAHAGAVCWNGFVFLVARSGGESAWSKEVEVELEFKLVTSNCAIGQTAKKVRFSVVLSSSPGANATAAAPGPGFAGLDIAPGGPSSAPGPEAAAAKK